LKGLTIAVISFINCLLLNKNNDSKSNKAMIMPSRFYRNAVSGNLHQPASIRLNIERAAQNEASGKRLRPQSDVLRDALVH